MLRVACISLLSALIALGCKNRKDEKAATSDASAEQESPDFVPKAPVMTLTEAAKASRVAIPKAMLGSWSSLPIPTQTCFNRQNLQATITEKALIFEIMEYADEDCTQAIGKEQRSYEMIKVANEKDAETAKDGEAIVRITELTRTAQDKVGAEQFNQRGLWEFNNWEAGETKKGFGHRTDRNNTVVIVENQPYSMIWTVGDANVLHISIYALDNDDGTAKPPLFNLLLGPAGQDNDVNLEVGAETAPS